MSGSGSGEVEDRVEVGPYSLVLRRPADAEALLDEAAFARDEFLPYWAEPWPSGVALARHVAGLDLAGRSVLELGCGLGLPSLVAALRGGEVTATDWADEALELLGRNAAANRIALETARLDWFAPSTLEGRAFDLVLAADVLYEERNAGPLLDLLSRVVAGDGEALLADPGRRHAAGFLERARARWHVEAVPVAALPHGAVTRLRRREGVRPPF